MKNITQSPRSLIAIGYWRSDHHPELPHPIHFVNDQVSINDRKLLIDYLEKGQTVITWLGHSYCRFNCGIPNHEMGAACFTDGKFIWPEKLSHYIRDHNIWLPEAFILHTKKNEHYNFQEIDLKKELNPYNQIIPKQYSYHDYDWWKTFNTLP